MWHNIGTFLFLLTLLSAVFALACPAEEVTKTSKIGIFAPVITERDTKTIEVAREQCKIRYNKCLKKVEIIVAEDGSIIYQITCSGDLK
jgi:hypothetical protein